MDRRMRQVLVLSALGAAVAAAVAQQLRRPPEQRTWTGRVAGLPYDFRRPTADRVVREYWDPDSDALWTPHAFGIGYGVNLARVARWLGVPAAQQQQRSGRRGRRTR